MFETAFEDAFTEAVLISDDCYLATGLRACFHNLRWVRSEECIDYVGDCSQRPYLVMMDIRIPGMTFLLYQYRGRANNRVVLLCPRRTTSQQEETLPGVIAWLWLSVDIFLATVKRTAYLPVATFPKDCHPISLTVMEVSVFSMLFNGESVAQIALHTGLSIKSIYGHRGRVVKKYGFKTYSHFYHTMFQRIAT